MSAFVDRVMINLSDPAQLKELVAPAADVSHQRVRQLFAAVYALPFAVVHDVKQVDVLTSEFQRPLFPPRRLVGTWTQTTPSYVRTDIQYESHDGLTPTWLDVTARLAVTVLLEVDNGTIESIRIDDIGDFTTIDEFEAKFRFFDLAAFMAAHGITTVDELKRAYRFLLGEIKIKSPPQFDPHDPANQRRFELDVAVLIRDNIDVAACLRDTRLARETVEHTLPYRREVDSAEVRTPYAPILVLPEAAVPGTGVSQADLAAFFAAQDVLAAFVSV